jgi:hypothetical protein
MKVRSCMKVRSLRVITVLSLTATAGGLAAAPTALANIVVGEGIAGLTLGSSEAHIIKVLGQPTVKERPDYQGKVEWRYTKPPLFGTLVLSHRRLNAMSTSSKHQKTSKGIGAGSSLAQVRTAYPKAKCSTEPFGPGSLTVCVLKSEYDGRVVETTFPFFTSMGAQEVSIDFA